MHTTYRQTDRHTCYTHTHTHRHKYIKKIQEEIQFEVAQNEYLSMS